MSKWPNTSHLTRKKRQLAQRDGLRDRAGTMYFVCYLCGVSFTLTELRVEHKQPRSREGTDELSNLGLACEDCDTEKADMTVEEYREYVRVRPEKGVVGGKKERHIIRSEIRGLTHALGDSWPNRDNKDTD